MVISNVLLILLLLVRWKISGHFPLSNLYESLMFLSWCCTFLFLIYKTNFTINLSKNVEGESNTIESLQVDSFSSAVNTKLQHNVRSLEKIVGSIIASSALLLNAFATFSLPKEMQLAAPLVPALQSNWLMMHVTVMIISYATLIIGSLLAILFLILNKIITLRKDTIYIKQVNQSAVSYFGKLKDHFFKKPNNPKLKSFQNMSAVVGSPFTNNLIENINTKTSFEKENVITTNQSFVTAKQEKPRTIYSKLEGTINYLDILSYRIIGLGFPFLTIGILSGAVWANEAWGSYWSWDPKETWALLTWLVFAIYLHTRLTKGWQGEKPAFIAALGFFVVWFCYLGVNLIGEGLHSYGFFH
uniref:Cytochrome c biogenesis protein CcsA n=1 Tax=Pandorina colemaniae TaxID=47786 RepID=A0A6C0RWG1_9CHLO|nr:cytochrome c biogenesis protein [Pandorina colemaniae]